MHRCIVQHSTPATQSEGRSPRATPAAQSDGRCRKVPCPTQSEGRCRQVPRLPRRVKVDVAKYQACHANGQTGTKRATRASPVPKWHACHAECASMPSATPAMQSDGPCRQVPRLPRRVKIDVAKCHACHANSRGDHGAKREPSAPPEPAQCHKWHACQAERTSMSPRATPATQSDGPCRQVPRLQRRVKVDAAKCHACHAAAATTAPNGNQARHQSQRSAKSGTPAIRTSLNEEMPL